METIPEKKVNRMSKYEKSTLPPAPQKFNWTIQGKHDSFEKADEHRIQLLAEGKKVKVHLMGNKKSVFAVKTALPVKPIKKTKQEE